MMRFFIVLLLVSVSARHLVLADDTPRASEPMGKGVELYSWREPAEGQWRFSLLPGTNRNKALPEIKAAEHTISTVEALKQQLAHLAIGEYVFWFNPDEKQFAYPPKAIRDDIIRAAEASQLHFRVLEP